MAFVFGKAKKGHTPTKNEGSPGPAAYDPQCRLKTESAAPFNSSTFKTSQFDLAPSSGGPGYYNPPCQKDIQTDKSVRMTSTFSSKVQRFKTQPEKKNTNAEQPITVKLVSDPTNHRYNKTSASKYAYDEAAGRAKERLQSLQQANNKRRSQSIGANREFVRIVLSNPKNTEMLHSVFIQSTITQKFTGPGSYNLESSINLGRAAHVVDWSRSTAYRFAPNRGANKTPGPGSYSVDKQKKMRNSQSASFAYQGLRSHMDELIYRTKMPFKVKVIQQKGLRDRYPGPGHYNPNHLTSKSFHYGQDNFGSNCMQESQENLALPGPGYYKSQKPEDNNTKVKEQLKRAREKIFGKQKIKVQRVQTLCDQNKEEMRKQCLMEIQRTANKFYSLEQRCSSKIGNFSQADRWRDPRHSQAAPGPGQYRVSINSEQKEKRVHPGFNSTAHERLTPTPTSCTPFYNIDRNDMGKRVLRVRRNIENLRQIQIEKAPFNSREQRFQSISPGPRRSHSQAAEMDIFTLNENEKNERQLKFELMRKAIPSQAQPSATFKSKTKRSWVAPNPQPGPGNYYPPDGLQKKSFNKDYNYNVPLKIRSTVRNRSSLG